jgi:hypothetical protein
MTSTRNNNSPAEYCLQQKTYTQANEYNEYIYACNCEAYDPALPVLGFNPTKMPWNTFANNPVDIESSLFGINSTNLVDPQKPVIPEIKKIQEKEFFKTKRLIMPERFVVSKYNRPFPIAQ